MVDIIVLLIVALSAYVGSKRGFIRSLVGAASTVASLFVSVILYHPVSTALYDSEIGKKIQESVSNFFQGSPSVDSVGNLPIASTLLGGTELIAAKLAINAISFILVAIMAKLLIKVVMVVFNVASKLPIIKQANSLLGAILGIISGAIIIYVCIGIIAALEPSGNAIYLSKMIKESNLAVLFYYNNKITSLFAAFL